VLLRAPAADPAEEPLGHHPRRQLERRNGGTPRSFIRLTAPTASLVCSVESTRWPVSAAWMAFSAVSRVADLADHDDVRILAEDVAEGVGEVELDLRLHLHLD
jgi:hypothetical protein